MTKQDKAELISEVSALAKTVGMKFVPHAPKEPVMSDIDMMPDLLENFALEWEADIRFNKMSDGSEPGPDVKIRPREQGDRATVERRIAFMREAAAEITRLRSAIERLASPEAFIVAKSTNEEERARMFYAEAIPKGGIEDAEAYAVKRAIRSIAEKEPT